MRGHDRCCILALLTTGTAAITSHKHFLPINCQLSKTAPSIAGLTCVYRAASSKGEAIHTTCGVGGRGMCPSVSAVLSSALAVFQTALPLFFAVLPRGGPGRLQALSGELPSASHAGCTCPSPGVAAAAASVASSSHLRSSFPNVAACQKHFIKD